jgi:hypothetical protein
LGYQNRINSSLVFPEVKKIYKKDKCILRKVVMSGIRGTVEKEDGD